MDKWGTETALYNMDQPVLLVEAAEPSGKYQVQQELGYRLGLKRGVVEALAMVLGYKHNVNEIWQERPLTIQRGKYGRYENGTD